MNRKNLKKIAIFVSIFVIIIIAILSLIIYFSAPMKDKRILFSQFEQIPIYSDNNECNKISYSMIDNEFDYFPIVECIYQSTSSAERTIELYEQSLILDNWKCFEESVHADWYRRSYYKNGFRLNVLFFTNGKIDVRLSKSDIPANINNLCIGARMEYSEPYRNEEGSQYTPPSRWVMNN